MFKVIQVKALPDYQLWLKFEDGVQGKVDLSHLVGKGVFALWNDVQAFQDVYIGPYGELAWSDEIDLCLDALYMQVTGQSPEQLFPNLQTSHLALLEIAHGCPRITRIF